MAPYQTKRSTKVMDWTPVVALTNELANYAKFHMTYNDPALVLEITPIKILTLPDFK